MILLSIPTYYVPINLGVNVQSYSNGTRGNSLSLQPTYFFKSQYIETPKRWLNICQYLTVRAFFHCYKVDLVSAPVPNHVFCLSEKSLYVFKSTAGKKMDR